MSESTYQSSYGSTPQSSGAGAADMGAAAAEFRRNVQEASERLSNAGSQLVSLSQQLSSAIAEAKQAAASAQAAQQRSEELQATMQRDYGAVSDLVRDLQERIGALAILARPLSVEPKAEPVEAHVAPPHQANAAAEDAPAHNTEAEAELVSMTPEAEQDVQPEPPSSGYGSSSSQSWPSRNW